MSCNTNEKSIDLPTSINLHTPCEPLYEEDDRLRAVACEADLKFPDSHDSIARELIVGNDGEEVTSSSAEIMNGSAQKVPRLSITMPSSSVVEISQTFYWPLYSRPIDWILQEHVLETCKEDELELKTRRIAVELHSLEFFQSAGMTTNSGVESNDRDADIIKRLMQELTEEKEDWFSDLSGGQKSKVELVRKVFLHDKCPDVLLVDETMAPLDPTSKSLVMAKLKNFCSNSVIIVIYHTDVGQEKEVEGKTVECIPSVDFFDKNIHLDQGVVHIRETC
jgi:ABC-type dipeptide/oligopeptide/nickel transport system ATPase subunit